MTGNAAIQAAERARELLVMAVAEKLGVPIENIALAERRAFDVENGKELWKAQLPASGAATPITYVTQVSGKQFIVIAAGGHSKVTEEPQSDALVAFALPDLP